jgi:2',3'-cyclic-nucleotide 2'-phosphodiesterase (5'-nucleotidase family)
MFINNYFFTRFCIVSFFFINACAPKYTVVHSVSNKLYSIKSSIKDTISAYDFLDKYRKTLQQTMNTVVGYNDTKLEKAKPNSTLGNMVADAMYEAAITKNKNVTAAIANYGGIRLPSLPKGNVTKGQVFELMPFDNELVTVVLSGALIDSLCQLMADGGGWPISHFQFEIKNKKAINITLSNEPLNYNNAYCIALNEYMANGGDNCAFLKPIKKTPSGIIVRDAIMNYVVAYSSQNKSFVQGPLDRIK